LEQAEGLATAGTQSGQENTSTLSN
jgi:hypothetical protein